MNREELLIHLYGRLGVWFSSVNALVHGNQAKRREYLCECLAKAEKSGIVRSISEKTMNQLLNEHTGPDLLLFFSRLCPHACEAFLRGELPPYPWHTPTPHMELGKTEEDESIKNSFKFRPGQVMFDGKDLDLPTGFTIEVMKKLVDNFNHVVEYEKLDGNSSNCEASEQLRKTKRIIVKQFSSYQVPCTIKTKTREGYLLCPAPPDK